MGTVSWLGNTSLDWSTGSNWSSGTAPTVNDDVTIAASYPGVFRESPIHLKSLTLNSGVLELRSIGASDISGNLTTAYNTTLYLDFTASTTHGGSVLAIGGSLIANSSFIIGSDQNTAATKVSAASLGGGGGGYLLLIGSTAFATTLTISGAAGFGATPGQLDNYLTLESHASVIFGSGGITKVAGLLSIDGSSSFVAIAGNTTTNSALTSLSTVSGTFRMQGGNLTTTGALTNTGAFMIDNGDDADAHHEGGATVTLGGALTNSGIVIIGGINIDRNTTVSATALNNTSRLDLFGSDTNQAKLNIAGAASAITSGSDVHLNGKAVLAFGSGQVTEIQSGGKLLLSSSQSLIANASDLTSNSALKGLTSIGGNFAMEHGNLTTTGALTVSGQMLVDDNADYMTVVFGGSNVTIGGALTITGTASFGSGRNDLATTVQAASLSLAAGGHLSLSGATGAATTLTITGAAGFGTAGKLTGNVVIGQGAMIKFASGQINEITAGSGFSLSGSAARLVSGGDTTSNSALTGLAAVAGMLTMNGVALTTSSGLTLTGLLGIDNGIDVDTGFTGGAAVTIGGVLVNSGYLSIGSVDLNHDTTVTATGLSGTGGISLSGSATSMAKLVIAGAGPATITTGVTLQGKALLSFGSGQITTIASGGSLLVLSSLAHIANASDTATNSALKGLTSIAGTFQVSNMALTTTGALAVSGSIYVDYSQDSVTGTYGGSAITIGGALTISGSAYIGNSAQTADTVIRATTFGGAGSVTLVGNADHRTQLIATGAAGFGSTGVISAQLHMGYSSAVFGSGQITSISATGSVQLTGTSVIALAADTATNSALKGLTSNAGDLRLEGSKITTTGGLTNTGGILIDYNYNYADTHYGGGQLNVGGALTNAGQLTIGARNLAFNSVVSATSLNNTGGTISMTGSPTNQAQLTISGAAGFGSAGVLKGNIDLTGNAIIKFASGQISDITTGASLSLLSSQSVVANATSLTTNSALKGLTTIEGKLTLENGAVVTTQGLTNTGMIIIDDGYDAVTFQTGGSQVTIGGTLSNAGILRIGNTNLNADTTVTATGLNTSTGATLTLTGSATKQAALNITGTAGVLSGDVTLNGKSLITFASGQVTGIAAGGSLSLLGSGAHVALASSPLTNSALAGLNTVGGVLQMRGSSLAAYGGLTNTGTVWLGSDYGVESTYSFGGVFTNAGRLVVSNNDFSMPAVHFTSKGFVNSGTVELYASAGVTYIAGNFLQTATGGLTLEATAATKVLGNLNVTGAFAIEGGQVFVNAQGLTPGQSTVVANFTPGQLTGMFDHMSVNTMAGAGSSGVTSYATIGTTAVGLVYNNQAGTVTLKSVTLPADVVTLWTGTSGTWSTASHWDNGTPDFYSGVGIGGAGVTVTLDRDITIDAFVLAQNANLTTNTNTYMVVGDDMGIDTGSTLTVNSKFYEGGDFFLFGTLADKGGVVDLRGDVLGTGTVTLSQGGMLRFGNTVDTTITAQFNNTGLPENILRIDDLPDFHGSISGLSENDKIDIGTLAVTKATLGAGNVLTLFDAGNATLGSLTLVGTYTGRTFTAVSDGHGGAFISLAAVPHVGTAANEVFNYASSLNLVVIDAAGGNDTITGSAGADILTGGAGADSLNGGGGIDTADYSTAAAGLTAFLGGPQLNTGDAAGDTYTSIENVTGSAFADVLGGLSGGKIDGADGNDWLYGNTGAETLLGGNGNDVLEGGAGADNLDGGSGTDVVSYRHAAAGITLDLLAPTNSAGEAAGDTVSNVENIWGSVYNDTIVSNISGGGQVYGFEGNDTLSGSIGNDVFYGGTGADTITTGAGTDDIFFLSYSNHTNQYGTPEPYEGGDTITDFQHGVDHITVSRYWFGFGNVPGPAAALTSTYADFITTGTTSVSSKPTFFWNDVTKVLQFDPDGTGASAMVQLATLTGTTLTLSDIWTA